MSSIARISKSGKSDWKGCNGSLQMATGLIANIVVGANVAARAFRKSLLLTTSHFAKRRRFHLSLPMESIFVVDAATVKEKRTFWQDENLPPLPLPKLEDTISKYLDSCKPVLSNGEYHKTKDIAEKFKTNEGPRLHRLLEERSKKERNWLDKWWLDGYLEFRGPSGYLNFSGLPCFTQGAIDKDQLKSSALFLHFTMKFWLLLREEKLKQQKDSKGNLLSMYQFRYLFNACRIPLPRKDVLSSCFKTVYEGPCPGHVIIFHRKRMYKIPGVCPKTGELYTPSQFYKILLEIVKEIEDGAGVALLSELDRDSWSEARSHLIKLSPENKKSINEIDTAVTCLTLDHEKRETESEMLKYAIAESYGQRWMDKFNYLVDMNGQLTIHADHTPLDGIVVVTFVSYCETLLQTMKAEGVRNIWGKDELGIEKPIEVTFMLDDKIKKWMDEGEKVAENIKSAADCKILVFNQFGRTGLKKLGWIHPCAFVEICMQLAYMRKHGRPASTYETATTRIFYRGRTETLRTCTPEAVAFCRAMINGSPRRENLFTEACKKYAWLMEECKAGKGCDRHLLGLASIAIENGEELPELFKDEAYANSGGNGNFVLSTSFVGYSVAMGAVFPMREDGYGTFFRINNDYLYFSIIAYNQCPGTSAESFSEYLQQALIDVYELMLCGSRL